MASPVIAVISPGAMGAAIGARLSSAPHALRVLTHIPPNRSSGSHSRAAAAHMQPVSLGQIAREADWVLSVIPPDAAYDFALEFTKAVKDIPASERRKDKPKFADLNAVNPLTVHKIASLFGKEGLGVPFVDGSIIGGPPRGDYSPVIYASAEEGPGGDMVLKEFAELGNYGLKISVLRGEGAAVGAASALKMSYAGVTKGITGLASAMILAAYADSPGTAKALIDEFASSQPLLLARFTKGIPDMLPKAYRFHGEMDEISGFVTEGGGGGSADIHKGIAATYRRIAKALNGEGNEVELLEDFVKTATEVLEAKKRA